MLSHRSAAELWGIRRTSRAAVDVTAVGRQGQRGIALHRVRRALAQVGGEPPEVHSWLERRFVDFCRDTGLPPPAMNASVCGYAVDAVWLDRRLVVELDGFAFHGTRAGFERDRERDAALQSAGYSVLRVTRRRLTRDADGLQRIIRSFLRD